MPKGNDDDAKKASDKADTDYLAILEHAEKYPPADPTDWFCISGRHVVILHDAEVKNIIKQRHHATNRPG